MKEVIYILLRTFLIFITLIVIVRLLGKRDVGQLSSFDLVIVLIIADIATIGIDNSKLFFHSILSLFVLLFLQHLFSFALLKLPFLRKIIDGGPTLIILDGKVIYKNLKKEKYTFDDLICQIRLQGILDISEVLVAILENNGTLSVFTKSNYDKSVLPIIINGQIIYDNTKVYNLDNKDVLNMINKVKIDDILYLSYDGDVIKSFYILKNGKVIDYHAK